MRIEVGTMLHMILPLGSMKIVTAVQYKFLYRHDVVAPREALYKLTVGTNCRKIGNQYNYRVPTGVLYTLHNSEKSVVEPTTTLKFKSRHYLSWRQHTLYRL